MRHLIHGLAAVLGLALSGVRPAPGQELAMGDRAPRFLLSAASGPIPVDVSRTAVLRRRIALELRDVTLGEALGAIARASGLQLGYSRKVVPVARVVRLVAEDITVAGALSEVLFDTGTDVLFERDGQAAIVRRPPSPEQQAGTIAGRVTDLRTQAALAGATVVVEGTRHTAVSGTDGQYRIADVTPGIYTVRARYIGYAPASAAVAVNADQEATADFGLEKSAQRLDEVVTTGTLLPTEVRALPTPVSVIDERDIAIQRPQTVQELFRQAVPGAVAWNYNSSPYNTPFSVRGVSSLTAGTPSMKVFVDGVDAARNGFSPVDPNSIARIEVIRGPQAAAIYGSEAIGGVIQVFTKRGDPALDRPVVNAEVNLGLVQTPYPESDKVVRQEYKGSLRGGGSDVGYYLGGSYSHLGDWLPDGEISAQSTPSVSGGVNYKRGFVDLDISGRYYAQRGGNRLVNPVILQTGFAPFSKPSFQPMETQNQTVGTQLSVTPTTWWRTTVNAGIDRYSFDLFQDRPRFTTPDDTLLFVSDHAETRSSVGGSTSLQAALTANVSGSLTAGVDYWRLPVSDWYALTAVNTSGTITTVPVGAISATRTVTSNTGYYAQAQIGFHDALFLTAGLRAERNTDFGDSLGTPLLPRAGLAYVHPLGKAVVKLRGSWGRAIRAPAPGRKLGFVTPTSVQLPNPELGPERQQGWDAGIDVTLGRTGSLGLTYYNQVADDLADAVVLAVTPVFTQQYQNVGQVKNTGIEVEGTLTMGPVFLRGQYGYVHARIQQLSPTYAGDLEVGDEPLLSPAHTAGASLSVTPSARTTLSAGLVYVGEWTYYDNVALFRCFGGTGPCGASFRDYQTRYPGLLKVNVGASHQLTNALTAFVSIDNLTNNDASEANNLVPVWGRTSTAGLRLQY